MRRLCSRGTFHTISRGRREVIFTKAFTLHTSGAGTVQSFIFRIQDVALERRSSEPGVAESAGVRHANCRLTLLAPDEPECIMACGYAPKA